MALDDDPKAIQPPEITPPVSGGAAAQPTGVSEPAPVTGRRQALRDLRRQLTDDDLASPGAQKMLLDDLEQAEARCTNMEGYVERYHLADKRAAVLEERLRTQTAMEVAFGVGTLVGGGLMGVAPLFWRDQPKGWLLLVLGFLLSAGAVIARAVKK